MRLPNDVVGEEFSSGLAWNRAARPGWEISLPREWERLRCRHREGKWRHFRPTGPSRQRSEGRLLRLHRRRRKCEVRLFRRLHNNRRRVFRSNRPEGPEVDYGRRGRLAGDKT